MEFLSQIGMREALIGAGIVLVLAVLVDGLRRMRRERQQGIKMSIGLGGGFPEEEGYGPELPNGGARVVHRNAAGDRHDPVIGDTGPDDLAGNELQLDDPWQDGDGLTDGDRHKDMPSFTSEHELIILQVKARDPNGFTGSDLLEILLACDLRYGDKNILHRHEQADGQGSLQFSVANMIEPGTFDLEDINSFHTPGVTFFMALPGPEDPIGAFDCLVETANCLIKNLDATLLDEHHEVASLQVVNRYRERVAQFARRQLRETAS